MILLLGFRRIIRRTRDEGPFSPEAVRLLSGWHWRAGAAVAVAGFAHWAVEGLTNDLVFNAKWPDHPSIWSAVAAVVAVRVFVEICESGIRQRQDAYERGLAAQLPAERPVD